MYSVEEVCTTAMTMAGRGDKPSNEDLNNAVKMLGNILSDWATTRGVHLWDLTNTEINVPVCDFVTEAGQVYKCYQDHIAAADNKPGSGEKWGDYWVSASVGDYTPTPGAWNAGFQYGPNRTYNLNPNVDEDVLAVKVQHAGEVYDVKKIPHLDFLRLPMDSFGLPEKISVIKSAEGSAIHIWPANDQESARLLYYLVCRPGAPDKLDSMTLPAQWVPALYYALAVELGFFYNIGLDRLNILGQKARYEFAKASRTNESEVDECFVTPCY